MDCSPPGSSVYGDSLDKNTRVGCNALLQGIFPTQGSNPGLPHCRPILYHLSHQGSPNCIIHSCKLALLLDHKFVNAVLVVQLCPILYNPMDCSPPGSSIHGILQARILKWVAMLSSKGSSQPWDRTQVSHIAGQFFAI